MSELGEKKKTSGYFRFQCHYNGCNYQLWAKPTSQSRKVIYLPSHDIYTSFSANVSWWLCTGSVIYGLYIVIYTDYPVCRLSVHILDSEQKNAYHAYKNDVDVN